MAWKTEVKINGVEQFKKGLTDLQLEQFPFAMSKSINDISAFVQRAEKTQMQRDFDRPTPFTLNALKINYSTKNRLYGGVVFKDPPRLSEDQHYLYHNVFGVKRGFKKFEGALYARGLMPAGYYAVPGKGAKLDAYGNIPGSLIVQILSWFGANQNSGYTSASTEKTKAKKRRGTKKTYGFEYVSFKKKTGKLLPGIYRRTFTGFGTSLESIFIFVPKNQTGYQRSYKFYETAADSFNGNFKIIFNRNLYAAMLTAFR